eukprot:scaffold207416_cov51-Attheya_sp.AAC.1
MQAQDENEAALDVSDISLETAQRTLLTDETLSDVTLEGTDGMTVHTIRSVLAARSRVFRTMLFGDFAEANSSIIKINYVGTVLRCLVEFCLNNDVSSFHETFDENPSDIVFALADAARFFDLPLLKKKVLNHTFLRANIDPQLACSLFQEAKNKSEHNDDIQKMLLHSIRRNPRALLEGVVLFSMKPSSLEEILSGDTIQADELTLFSILKRWVMLDGDIPEVSEVSTETRKEIGTRLIRHINLDQIAPSDLVKTVAPSGLVPENKLMEIYTSHLLKAEESDSHLGSLNKPRYTPYKWRQSQSDVCKNKSDTLENVVLKSGIHEWSIRVLTHGNEPSNFTIGVQSTMRILERWRSYRVTGGVGNSNLRKTPKAPEDSVVKLTLDLTKRQHGLNGALYVAIDDGPRKLMFTDMLDEDWHGEEEGFIPSVNLGKNAGCRFLGFASDETYV